MGADVGADEVEAGDQDADPDMVIEVDEADNGELQPSGAGDAHTLPARRQAEEFEGHSEPADDTD